MNEVRMHFDRLVSREMRSLAIRLSESITYFPSSETSPGNRSSMWEAEPGYFFHIFLRELARRGESPLSIYLRV